MDPINSLLQREPEHGRQIKLLVVKHFKATPSQEESASFYKLWDTLDSAAGRQLTQTEAENVVLRSMLSKCQNLQTLVLAGGVFSFPLVAINQGWSLPLPFLTQSLKRLFLTSVTDLKKNMTAANMIWILGELRRSLAQARASNSKLTSNLSPGLQPFPRDLIGIVFCSNLT